MLCYNCSKEEAGFCVSIVNVIIPCCNNCWFHVHKKDPERANKAIVIYDNQVYRKGKV